MVQAEAIDFVRFTTVSPEMIKKMSVAKLIVPDTYNEDGYPIDGGLIDQRMGVVDPGLKCKTCGGRSKTCPGHFGHIEMIRPVIHPEFAKTIYFLLQNTCINCHRMLQTVEQMDKIREELQALISQDDIVPIIPPVVAEALPGATAQEAKPAATVKKVSKTANKKTASGMRRLKYLGKCPYCETKQKKIKFERPTMFYADGERIKPDEIKDWMSKIGDDDLKLFGIDAKWSRPEWFIIGTLAVPPVNVRPSITLETGERSEDDLTHKLVEILRINKKLEQDIDAGTPQIIIDDLWELLQYHVTTYFNNETPGVPVARHRSSRALKTLAQRLKGKEGRLRYNLSGKRVNFAARTVIAGDASLTINQVGVPKRFAENLTVPLHVTVWNMEVSKEWLTHKEYPLIINFITKEGVRKRVTEINREELMTALIPGTILERQLIDGDIILFNRQPTLHKHSMMAHTVKVLPGKVMRIHTSTTTPYNADFDGDECNLHVPQTLEAQAEARHLMQAKNILLSPREGRPVMTTEEDELIGIYHLTKDDAFFTKDEAGLMLASVGVAELPKVEKNGTYSGKRIFSMILPKDLDYEVKSSGANKVVIKKGIVEEGIIDEGMVGGGERSYLIMKLWEDYGADTVERFLLNISKLSLRAAYAYGVTLSLKDYYNSDEINKKRDEIIKSVESKTLEVINSYKEGKLEAIIGYTKKETLEMLTSTRLREARSLASAVLNKMLTPTNSAFLMAKVKARGNILNFVQISMFLGQQDVRGSRPSRGYSRRVLPYFRKGSRDPKSKGFVESSFVEGLDPIEFFMHAMGSRDSAVAKALVVPKSGYMYRRLLNAMQDFYVDQDLSVKDANGSIIQPMYGGNGIDPTLERVARDRAANK
jgi:DNA-directed RNA polymerase subunit A'